ncbi:recombination protein RecR [Candidatus Gottesmanbacteria bacterium]|nr:recombination protein RecR [Candidatus Gottesmanbacteria bacterium]
MTLLPKALSRLIESFEKLPGIGPKTATRLAFYLLHVPEEELERFAENLRALKTSTVLCSLCKNVAEGDPCGICSDPSRDQSVVCVVEQPTDVLSFEKTGKYKGLYHVLHGAIDPLNNIGPDEIYIADLLKRIKNQELRIKEIILATNPNMEGEATAMYIQKQLSVISHQSSVKLRITRLAHGLPMGADIEYADEVTLSRALEGRREYQ